MMCRQAENEQKTVKGSTKVHWDLDTDEDVYAEELKESEQGAGMRIWVNLLILLLVIAAMIVKSLIG